MLQAKDQPPAFGEHTETFDVATCVRPTTEGARRAEVTNTSQQMQGASAMLLAHCSAHCHSRTNHEVSGGNMDAVYMDSVTLFILHQGRLESCCMTVMNIT